MTTTHAGWRNGLVVAFVAFIGIIAAMVGIALSQREDLVVDNYYERSLRHDQQMASAANARRLGTDLSVRTVGEEMLVSFPRSMEPAGIAGRCTLYRPSNRSLDRTVDLRPDSTGVQRIPLTTMLPGVWKAQLSWEYRGNAYYLETPIVLE
jgi:hypothetical protein